MPVVTTHEFAEARRPGSVALRRFQEELAYYRADEPYLTAEKCAERCWMLSLLLTAALTDTVPDR